MLIFGWPAQLALRAADGHADGGLREAAQTIMAQRQPGDAIAYDERRAWLRLGMDYYLPHRDRPVDALVTRTPIERNSTVQGECVRPSPCLAGVPGLWVICLGQPSDSLLARRAVDGQAGKLLGRRPGS